MQADTYGHNHDNQDTERMQADSHGTRCRKRAGIDTTQAVKAAKARHDEELKRATKDPYGKIVVDALAIGSNEEAKGKRHEAFRSSQEWWPNRETTGSILEPRS